MNTFEVSDCAYGDCLANNFRKKCEYGYGKRLIKRADVGEGRAVSQSPKKHSSCWKPFTAQFGWAYKKWGDDGVISIAIWLPGKKFLTAQSANGTSGIRSGECYPQQYLKYLKKHYYFEIIAIKFY